MHTAERWTTLMATESTTSPSRLVLIVDDDDDLGDLMREALSLEGHRIQVASAGAQALVLARSFRPDVVLVDIAMPGMDGYELARLLRASPRGKGLLLVAVTGLDAPEDKERARRAGFDLYLVKPFTMRSLRVLLE